MNLNLLITHLTANAERIRTLLQGVSDAQGHWKPTPTDWSIVEVVNHLYDEENEDFRAHLDHILRQSEQPWPRIDPQGWVTERGYNQRNLDESLTRFLAARQQSLAWLAALPEPDWAVTATAPWGGPMSAGDMAASWIAHDLLHIRQLVELLWADTVRQLAPSSPEYAGEW